jgi:hypothetical protein
MGANSLPIVCASPENAVAANFGNIVDSLGKKAGILQARHRASQSLARSVGFDCLDDLTLLVLAPIGARDIGSMQADAGAANGNKQNGD